MRIQVIDSKRKILARIFNNANNDTSNNDNHNISANSMIVFSD